MADSNPLPAPPLAATADDTGRSPGRVVARNTAVTLVAQLLIKLLTFAFSIFVVRHLGDADFGRYCAALAYVAVFAMLTDLGTSSLSVREMARARATIAWMVPDIAALRIALSVLAIAGITASAHWLGQPPEMVKAIAIASCGLLLYAVHGPLDAALIARERFGYAAAFYLLNQAVFIALGTLALLTGAGYVGLLLAGLAGVAAMALAAVVTVMRAMDLRFSAPQPRRWWPLVRSSLPFGVMGATSEIGRRFATVYMSFTLSDAAVGWYNVPLGLCTSMLLMAQSLGLAIFPSMVKEFDGGRDSIGDTMHAALRYLLLLSLPMAVGGTLLAERIILTLYGVPFAPAVALMRIMVWALPTMFALEILGRAVSAMGRERAAARVSVVAALLNIAVIVAGVRRYGVEGAAVAMVVSRLLAVVLTGAIIGRSLFDRARSAPLLRIAAASGILAAALWLARDAALLDALGNAGALAALVLGGAVCFAVAALGAGAVTAAEARAAAHALRHRLVATGSG